MNDSIQGHCDARFDKVADALGQAIGDGIVPIHPRREDLLLGGWGGSWETTSPDRRMTTAYVMNKMGPGIEGSARTARYPTLIYDAVS